MMYIAMMSATELNPTPLYIKSTLFWLIFTSAVGFLQMTYVFKIEPLKPIYFIAPGAVGLIFGLLTGHIIFLSRKLKWCSLHDPLTEVYNHRHYQHTLNDWCNSQSTFSLILFDVDHFKNINDKYGHKFGDNALIHICDLVHQTKRMYDIFARHGGEEFAVLTPRTDLSEAEEIAKRICEAISENPMPPDIQLTCSFGVAHFRPESDTANALFERADKALYQSKREGRNRVTLESPQLVSD